MSAEGSETISWRDLWIETTERLGDRRHARWMVEEVSGLAGDEWASGLDAPAHARAVEHLDTLVARRLAGEPLQYVLGHWAFRTLDLLVDPRVLIPRPETELVADVALEVARSLLRGRDEPLVVVDLGTGSGALALSMAAELPIGRVAVWAVDVSADAVDVARANLAGLDGRRAPSVRIAQGSWFEALPAELEGVVDVVVTNPPYVAEVEVLDPAVDRWEPAAALRAGPSGLEAHRAIALGAARWLRPGGALVAEVGAEQGRAVSLLAAGAGLIDVTVRPDLAGRDRVLVARRPSRLPG